MLRRDRRSDSRAGRAHEFDSVARGDVFENDAQPRKAGGERRENLIDEARLAIEDIDARVCHLTVHLQRHIDRAHGLEDTDRACGCPCTPSCECVVAPAG